jgi:hypothetical protein
LQAIELSNGGKYAKADRRTQGEEHMTRDDITRIARVAGFVGFDGDNGSLRRFAALVRADERNKLAQWMIDHSFATGHGDTVEDLLKELEWQVRESEREACAQVAEDSDHVVSGRGYYDQLGDADATARNIAIAIRARGQA